eukprot:CAMPEP_0116547192 /NCGR_PEP_ID=MMETSP0397-20121206/3641_1 /TAXON_ID=216820 /ORGANISM="Cyclophora tenuis, Strain ECT3854" /LENGTH=198 /DNA_ID=CAMNT_0004071697 /DNA_START=209 /DNA_END=805 /DNA_ORIENTATION=-
MTDEIKERIRRNRERALEIQKKRKEGRAVAAAVAAAAASEEKTKVQGDGSGGGGSLNGHSGERDAKRRKKECKEEEEVKKVARTDLNKRGKSEEEEEEEEEGVVLEDFEISASPFVTKKEAMQAYCLPEGTLAVCSYAEKENPRHKGWTPMKLYNRAEIRRRARKRFGGMEGLIAERTRREQKRFERDLEATKDIFKS